MMQTDKERAEPSTSSRPPGTGPSGSALVKWIVILAIVVLVAMIVSRGINDRIKAASIVKEETQSLAIPAVSVIHPRLGESKQEIVLPGNLQAFTYAPIYARTSGYLKKWYFDIGAQVKAGQVLAEIDAPELDQQLRQAKANLQQAQAALEQALANRQQSKANEEYAKITADRWKQLTVQGVVSSQDNDQKQSQYQALVANSQALDKAIAAARSNVSAQEANIGLLEQLQDYRMVKAPFDGVITARNTDIGALINAGNGGTAQELFRMAASQRLRLFVNVPEVSSRAAVPGLPAELVLAEYPGRKFHGTLVRTADAMDAATRTLLTEIDVDNASGELRPGSYAEVHMALPGARALIVPVSSVLFRSEGLRIGVVHAGKNGESTADMMPVTLGKDFGNEVEITSGITERDLIIENAPDSLVSGTVVRVTGANKP
jgi:RND family efflux transporter MFP subunit